MKEKKIYILILLGGILTSFFIFMYKVNANTVFSDEVPNNSYVIGTYMFTGDVMLSTKHIMLASKSIEGNNLNDMIIYYKTPRGIWIDGLTGEVVSIPQKIKITNYNTISIPEVPTLNDNYNSNNEIELSICNDGIYSDTNNASKISGWELYEKTADGYQKIVDSKTSTYKYIIKDLELGIKKVYVARVYKMSSNDIKIYSEYSNEISIGTEIATPTLSTHGGSPYEKFIGVIGWGNYTTPESYSKISGWELYEKINDKYILNKDVNNNNYGNDVGIFRYFELNTSKTFVARVYMLNSKGKKIYSEYSNEFTIPSIEIETPVLSLTSGELSVVKENPYSDQYLLPHMSGWELYEKIDNDYIKITDDKIYSYSIANLNFDTSKTYVARVYVLNSNNEKLYSNYSNEIVIGE